MQFRHLLTDFINEETNGQVETNIADEDSIFIIETEKVGEVSIIDERDEMFAKIQVEIGSIDQESRNVVLTNLLMLNCESIRTFFCASDDKVFVTANFHYATSTLTDFSKFISDFIEDASYWKENFSTLKSENGGAADDSLGVDSEEDIEAIELSKFKI